MTLESVFTNMQDQIQGCFAAKLLFKNNKHSSTALAASYGCLILMYSTRIKEASLLSIPIDGLIHVRDIKTMSSLDASPKLLH